MPSKTKIKVQTKNAIQQANDVPAELPRNWPDEIKFLNDQSYTTLAAELRPKLSRAPSDNNSWLQVQSHLIHAVTPHVQIITIDDEKHPAFGQRGLFAAEDLIPDQFVLLYLGKVHSNSLSDTNPHSDYDLSLDREIGLSVDAAEEGNESRCANDYRGIAERPNAEFRDCYIQVSSTKRADGVRWERRVGIFVLSAGKAGLRKGGIKAGKEILVSYGKGFWEGRKLLGMFRKDAAMLKMAEAALEC